MAVDRERANEQLRHRRRRWRLPPYRATLRECASCANDRRRVAATRSWASSTTPNASSASDVRSVLEVELVMRDAEAVLTTRCV